jgi:hypothetical protein
MRQCACHKNTAPAVWEHPGTRPTGGDPVDTTTVAHPAPPTNPNARAERALELYRARVEEISSLGEDNFEVPSCTGRGLYIVRYGGEVESCTCKDFEIRGEACKHLLAVGIAHARRRSGVKVVSTLAVAAGDPFKAASKTAECAGCGKRSAHGDVVEIGPELLTFGIKVLEGERYCRPCARRRGVL